MADPLPGELIFRALTRVPSMPLPGAQPRQVPVLPPGLGATPLRTQTLSDAGFPPGVLATAQLLPALPLPNVGLLRPVPLTQLTGLLPASPIPGMVYASVGEYVRLIGEEVTIWRFKPWPNPWGSEVGDGKQDYDHDDLLGDHTLYARLYAHTDKDRLAVVYEAHAAIAGPNPRGVKVRSPLSVTAVGGSTGNIYNINDPTGLPEEQSGEDKALGYDNLGNAFSKRVGSFPYTNTPELRQLGIRIVRLTFTAADTDGHSTELRVLLVTQ